MDRRLRPGDVISIALGPERQEQQNVRKLRGLPQDRWESLVNLIDANGNTTPLEDVCGLLDLDPQRQEAEALAILAPLLQLTRHPWHARIRALHQALEKLTD